MTDKKKQGGPAYAPLPPRYYIFGDYDVWDKVQMLKYADDTHELRMRSLQANPTEWPLPHRSALDAAPAAKFKVGDLVTKTKGSQWKGRVVGTYSTTLTPEGYAVESSTERGSVQIYPAAALELVQEARAEQSAITSESGTPPAEQQAQLGAVYAELCCDEVSRAVDVVVERCISLTQDATGIKVVYDPIILANALRTELRGFADRTHALRMEQAAPKAAPWEQNAVSAEWLEQAYREGWAACRDAETIGEEAESWAFGNSTANSRMIDAQQTAPQQEAQADSQPVPVVDKCTKQQLTTEVLRRMQQQEDGHNKNPFRSLLDRLMRNEGGYSTIEIGQLKYALDGFYGAARAPADSVTAPAATVIKKGADRQWMSERLGHLPDGIYSLYLAPQQGVSQDTLYLLRRLLSNQHTLTGPEFRAELEKIVGEAYQQEVQEPSEAEIVFAAISSGEWAVTRNQPSSYLTDEGNARNAWSVQRAVAPYCADLGPGKGWGNRVWNGPTALAALEAASREMGIPLPVGARAITAAKARQGGKE